MKKNILYLLLLVAIQQTQAQHIRYLFEFGKPGINNGEFSQPSGIDIDHSNGKIYVTDYTGNRVQVFDTLGNYLTKIINPTSLAGTFNVPSSVCINKGSVYISEFYGNQIQVYDSKYSKTLTIGSKITNVSTDAKKNGAIYNPTSVQTDVNGLIYVSEKGNSRVQVFNQDGTFNKILLNNLSIPNLTIVPLGLAVSSDSVIYISDQYGDRVLVLEKNGTLRKTIGSSGIGNGYLNQPSDVALDTKNNVFIVDKGNNRIQIFNEKGQYLHKFGLEGTDTTQFSSPIALTILNRKIYVVDKDNNRIQVFYIESLPKYDPGVDTTTPKAIFEKSFDLIPVFPNPSKNGFIMFENSSNWTKISAFNSSGKEYELHSSNDQIDISHLDAGVYLLRGSLNSVNKTIGKIIVEK